MDSDNEYDERDDRPSKSARKREAHALQKLGERLVQMRPQDVVGLPLGDTLREAITEARRLSGTRGALARQYQYIGKLMRGEDLPAIEAALTALEVARNPRGKIAR